MIPEIDISFSCEKIPALFSGDGRKFFFPFRRLGPRDGAALRLAGFERYYLPPLSEESAAKFFSVFDDFWSSLAVSYGPDDPFWRTALSSKMQEWDASVGYLCLVLFTLEVNVSQWRRLLVIPSCVEEAELLTHWALARGWKVNGTLSSAGAAGRRAGQWFDNLLRCCYGAGLVMGRWWRLGRRPSVRRHEVMSAQAVIATLFYPGSLSGGQYRDPFFGSLHGLLKDAGLPAVYLAEPLEFPSVETAKLAEANRDPMQVTYQELSLGEVLGAVLAANSRRIVRSDICFMGLPMGDILRRASGRYFQGFNIMAEIYYRALRNVLCRGKAVRVYTIFEGNVYERACIQAARSIRSRRVEVFAHSQAAVFPLSLKIRVCDGEKAVRPEPDVIVCSGQLNARGQHETGLRPAGRLRKGCVLKVLASGTVLPPPAGRELLVALDGFASCSAVVDWLAGQKDVLAEWTVILRRHPNISEKFIRQQCSQEWPAGFRFSERTLDQDLASARVVVYRHASVGVQALLLGVPCIHAAVDCPLFGDPVPVPIFGHWRVSDGRGLAEALGQVLNLDEAARNRVRAEAGSNLSECFATPDVHRFRDFTDGLK